MVVDASERLDGSLSQLQAMGVRTIFRYYALRPQPGLKEKILEAEEARRILNEGLSLAVVYQYYSTKYENFNAVKGEEAARHAVTYGANTIRQPPGSAIYFGVDGSWGADRHGPIIAYFEGVQRVCSDYGYKVGVYGSGLTCRLLKELGLVSYTWLPKSRGWWESQAYFNRGRWDLFQSVHEYPLPGTGKKVDYNLVAPGSGNFGQWSLQGLGMGHARAENQAVINGHRFIRASTLVLYRQKSQSSPEVARFSPALARTTRLLGVEGDWAYVWFGDQYGSGANGFRQGTGWCPLNTLTADYSTMP